MNRHQIHQQTGLFATLTAACLVASLAQAAGEAKVAGVYQLVGVREVGSEIMLSADGKFEYGLA